MPVAPRAASASPSKPEGSGRHGWAKRQRLLRAPEFDAPAAPHGAWRATRRWLALSAAILIERDAEPVPVMAASSVRFGLIVPRRQAQRAVARNTVKRILREAARHAAPGLEALCTVQRLHVVLRLKSSLPGAAQSNWSGIKATLRSEADALLEQLRQQLLRAAGER